MMPDKRVQNLTNAWKKLRLPGGIPDLQLRIHIQGPGQIIIFVECLVSSNGFHIIGRSLVDVCLSLYQYRVD